MNLKQQLRQLRNELLHDNEPPLEVGCEVILASLGMWGHVACCHLYVLIDWRHNSGKNSNRLDRVWRCSKRGEPHRPHQYYMPKQGYPPTAEILEGHNEKLIALSMHSNNIQILGKPVSLTDLLLMLNSKNQDIAPKTEDIYYIDMFGGIYKGGVKFNNALAQIDPTKGDNMELQDDEVIEQLISILRK